MTAPSADDLPFRLQVGYDQEELLGARWWHEGMPRPPVVSHRAGTGADLDRRELLTKLVVAGGCVLVGGVVLSQCLRRTTHTVVVDRNSLELQQEKGLAVQATSKVFLWPGASTTDCQGNPLDRDTLAGLTASMRPSDDTLVPAYVPTLFQVFAGDRNQEFTSQFTMIRTPAMATAFAQGQAIRELLEHAERARCWALVVDLPGPESVAFAAGLQPFATAVFTFDNWPHPNGVVPSHLTLAAAVYYRALFAADERHRDAPAAFVLDRDRLATWRDEPSRFDNRYVAKLPDAPALQARGVQRVLYVVPAGGGTSELDDLNQRFVAWRAAGIEVQMLCLGDVRPDPAAASTQGAAVRHYWHGSPAYHWWFWNHYGWASSPGPIVAMRPPTSPIGSSYSPARRSTMFDGVPRLGQAHEARTENVPRSGGSWARSSGGYGGGFGG